MYNDGYSADGSMFGLLGWLIIFAIYFYFAFMQYKIAKRCYCSDNAWWSFVPVLNALLLIQMAGKPQWWFLLFFVPILNFAVFSVLWAETAKRSGNSEVWGMLFTVPLFNIVAAYVMAFSGGPSRFPERPREMPPQRTPQNVG